jgi:hypothetical protein
MPSDAQPKAALISAALAYYVISKFSETRRGSRRPKQEYFT